MTGSLNKAYKLLVKLKDSLDHKLDYHLIFKAIIILVLYKLIKQHVLKDIRLDLNVSYEGF